MKANNFTTNPMERAAHLATETGEAIKAMIELGRLDPAHDDYADDLEILKEDLGKEVFDVIWNVLAMAEVTGVDVEAAMRLKMKENRKRKFKTTV